ncbi:hypothetical protein CLOM_g12639 [Closterium sp. NIES-68]|nr:hypothetical protein CLOM_g12639 [Closterium sp. NIES-68]GJP68585.1 hypothetical protein CLOP_g25265 [Closterium sp. NIES-67]
MANEELLLFFYQLDLNTRLQKALNLDQYEPAQLLREKIAELDREIARQREAKMGTSSKEEAQDKGLALLRLKAGLQRAVEQELYEEAAEIRKKMSKLEGDTLAASAAALAMGNVIYKFRLGQKITHKEFGYRGIVAGMDPMCCETEEWMSGAQISRLSRGPNQPFYQILLDLGNGARFPVAYVAEDLLDIPVEPDKEQMIHPYLYLLFYGADSRGDFIPCKPLRDKYNAPRYEVPLDDSDDTGSDES